MTTNNAVADLIDSAADWLTNNRWCKGTVYREKDDASCALGALRRAGGGYVKNGWLSFPDDYKQEELVYAAESELNSAARVASNGQHFSIAGFNDQRGLRDKRKVTRLMRRTARNLRKAA